MNCQIPTGVINGVVEILKPYREDLTPPKFLSLISREDLSEEEFWTRKEASEKLKVSVASIDRMLSDGQLIKLKRRGRVFVVASSAKVEA